MSGCELQRMAGAQRQPHEHRPLDAGRVHGRDGVGDVLLVRVGRGPIGRSAAPLPRPSTVTTRNRRASAGTCSFHWRMWMTAHDVRNTSVGRPVPVSPSSGSNTS